MPSCGCCSGPGPYYINTKQPPTCTSRSCTPFLSMRVRLAFQVGFLPAPAPHGLLSYWSSCLTYLAQADEPTMMRWRPSHFRPRREDTVAAIFACTRIARFHATRLARCRLDKFRIMVSERPGASVSSSSPKAPKCWLSGSCTAPSRQTVSTPTWGIATRSAEGPGVTAPAGLADAQAIQVVHLSLWSCILDAPLHFALQPCTQVLG